MKSSTQVFASLVAALATFSQPAIATYIHADRQVNINSDAINAGTKNRKNLLECSQAKPCINDRIVIDSYKEVFSESGKLQEAKIVLYNTSFAPVAIEVFSSDGKFKSVEFVDGAKAGFKDLGDFLKTASAGLIGPFQCTTNWFECLGDSRYGIEKNERNIKLQAGDVIRISRGSDAAFAYTIASSNIGLLELLTSIPGITPSKVTSPSLLKNYSPELKRRIIQGFIIQKMNEKYTWKMIFEQLGYEAYKKSASNPQDLLNNTLEIVQNVPQDFWKNMTDGTVAATAAGDVVDTLVQTVSSKASIALNSSLFISQSVNIRATYTASEVAHNKPYLIVIAGLKDSSTNSNQPIATKPSNRSSQVPTTFTPQQPSSLLKKAIVSQVFSGYPRDIEQWNMVKPPFSFTEVDLDNDGKKETIVLYRLRRCSNRSCSIDIFRSSNQKKPYQFISEIGTSRNGLEIALLPTKSRGWQDLAVQYFSYETRTIDWYSVKFDGKTYKVSDRKLTEVPKNIILSEKSPSFDLGDFSEKLAATLANESEVQKTATTLKSVSQVRGYLKELRSPCVGGCSGYGLHIRAVRVCTLIQALDTRIGSRIVKEYLPSSSENSINISGSDLNLMKMIYGQCKWYKRLPSDLPEITYYPSSNTIAEKIDKLLYTNK
jgi:hypothetical protein